MAEIPAPRPAWAPHRARTGPPRGKRTPHTDDIDAVLRNDRLLTMFFQPIIDLQSGRVAGYEALARFPAERGQSTESWFEVADAAGRGARLEALALSKAMRMRGELPSHTFLSVNVSPHLVTSPEVQEVLAGDLRGVVLELTEHVRAKDEPLLVAELGRLRARGVLVALDDAGSGYSGLRQVASLRPSLVKLDRSLVDGVDHDPAKLVLAKLLGSFSGELDAWLLAEGVETLDELQVFLSLGVPLAQGYLFGRPAPGFARLDPQLAARIAASAALTRSSNNVASLVVPVVTRLRDEPSSSAPPIVVLDDDGRPIGIELERRRGAHQDEPVCTAELMTVHPSDEVSGAAARAMTRPEPRRYDPLVMTGSRGQVLGLVPIDALVLRLAEMQHSDEPAAVFKPAVTLEPQPRSLTRS